LLESGHKITGAQRGSDSFIDKKIGSEQYRTRALPAWLGAADNGNLYILTAVGAGDIKDNGLQHYSFGNGGNHRVDTIQAVVQHVEAPLNTFDILRFAGSCRRWFTLLRQSDTS